MFFNLNKIVENVKSKNRIYRITVLFFGTFLLALSYNMFLEPNNLVTGGISGLAIILQRLTPISSSFYIYLFSIVLIVIAFFALGAKEGAKSTIGAILYPLMVSLTSPLAVYLNNTFILDSYLIEVLVASLIIGFASGIIYKVGYSSGGSDIIVQILNKYAHLPIGKANFIINTFIILLGGALFGINNVIYAIIIVYLNSYVVDRILLGISNSKQFFIYTKEINKVREFIIKKLDTGVTIMETTGGYSKRKKKMLMCVVSTKDYYLFKESVLEIDPNAFFVINDCYEVSGGVRRSPFIH